jgi:tetratricopeptide (TPR) repeat protein
MLTDGAFPTKPQIERQLIKMLENEIFTSRRQQGKLLELIVKTALAGEDVTEKMIREKLFPVSSHYKEDSPIARRTIDLLRASLNEYYQQDLSDPLVIIYLLKSPVGKRIKFAAGEAYKPRFAYNDHHPVSRDYLLGCRHLGNGYLSKIPDAVAIFHKILEREPEHAGAMLYMADAFCFTVIFGILPDRRENMILNASSLIDRAAPYAPGFWHVHSARALVHCCRDDFVSAQQEFDNALRLDRERTESSCSSLYSLFLLANGRAADALQLKAFMVDEEIDNPEMHAVHGIHLAVAARFDEAESAFRIALELDRNCFIAHIGAMRLNLARGRTQQAQHHADRLKELLEPVEYEFWMARIKALHANR